MTKQKLNFSETELSENLIKHIEYTMKTLILTLGLLLSGITVYSQNARVVGYLPTYRFALSSQIDYCKLTHLNLAFANPDSAGNIVMPSISSVVADALNDNPDIVIMVSMAGGVLSAQQAIDWSNLIDIPANRPPFIEKIVDYVLNNDLDGVDVDLEWSHVTSGYSDFVVELDYALQLEGKSMTAALPNLTLFSNINQAALDAFDFINIMAYDATGPWNPSLPGQHSSYSFAEDGIDFWKNSVGIASSRLNLGLPFYGYDFVNSSTVNAFTYAQMVNTDPSYADLDNVGTAYYNGRPTIESKIELASNEVGGVLIWELGQDSYNQYSLLTTIHDKYTSLGVLTSGLCGNDAVLSTDLIQSAEKITLFPNPSSTHVSLSNLQKERYFTVHDIMGKQLIEGTIYNYEYLDISHLSNGMYYLRLDNGTTAQFMKK